MNNDKKTNETLIIYQKYLDLIYYTNDLCRKYPKSEKVALAAETKQSLYDGLRHLMYAYKEYNKRNKLSYLNNLDVELNLQKVFKSSKFLYNEKSDY